MLWKNLTTRIDDTLAPNDIVGGFNGVPVLVNRETTWKSVRPMAKPWPYYPARALMSPSPDPPEAVLGSWVDSWVDPHLGVRNSKFPML